MTEKFCPKCGKKMSKIIADDNSGKYSIKIADTRDVIDIGFSGSGNIIGKNIVVVGSGTIDVSQQELAEIPSPEYANALKNFSASINQQLDGLRIPEEKLKWINNSLDKLAKEVKDVTSSEVEREKVDYLKQIQIELKIASVIQRVLNVLPEAHATTAIFEHLDPFSKLIGRYVSEIVHSLTKGRKW
ncbi:MAG: hypothetical protein M3Z01_08960 [Thermoproteota archaeon]|nr:hypothetical protein [Thermoproteota archaeon]